MTRKSWTMEPASNDWFLKGRDYYVANNLVFVSLLLHLDSWPRWSESKAICKNMLLLNNHEFDNELPKTLMWLLESGVGFKLSLIRNAESNQTLQK